MPRIGSWIVVDKRKGEAVFETFKERTANTINNPDVRMFRDYEAVPVRDYLAALNKRIKENGGVS